MVERAVVLDARDEIDYEEKHVGKAVNVPAGIDMTSARAAVRKMSTAKVLPVNKAQVSEEWLTEADIVVTMRVLWEWAWAPSASYSFALLTLRWLSGRVNRLLLGRSFLSFPPHSFHFNSHIRSLSH